MKYVPRGDQIMSGSARQHDYDQRARAYTKDAINTMRRFLDDAERALDHPGVSVEEAISDVVSKIGWGIGNSLSGISTALVNLGRRSE